MTTDDVSKLVRTLREQLPEEDYHFTYIDHLHRKAADALESVAKKLDEARNRFDLIETDLLIDIKADPTRLQPILWPYVEAARAALEKLK
jgi:hypothetical protein